MCLVRFWRPPTAISYLNRATRVFLTLSMHMQGQGCIRIVKAYVRRNAYVHVGRKVKSNSFLYLECDSSAKTPFMISIV